MAMARRFMSRLLSAKARMRFEEMCAWQPHCLGQRVDDALGFEQHRLAGRICQHVDVEGSMLQAYP